MRAIKCSVLVAPAVDIARPTRGRGRLMVCHHRQGERGIAEDEPKPCAMGLATSGWAFPVL